MASLRSILIPLAAIFIFGSVIALRFIAPRTEEVMPAETVTEPPVIIVVEPPPPAPEGRGSPNEIGRPPAPAQTARIYEKRIPAPVILVPPPPPPPAPVVESPVPAPLVEVPAPIPPPPPPLPPVNEDELQRAVVRIRCGRLFGSGFAINKDGLALTAAHVLIEAIESGVTNCDVIFPRKSQDFGFFSEAHYRTGIILTPKEVEKMYKEKAIDVAAIKASRLENDPVFPEEFPFINHPFCGPQTLGDKILLYGYAANASVSINSPGSLLSRFEGRVIQYGDIRGVKKEPSTIFKSGFDYVPDLSYTLDESADRAVAVIVSTNNFSGASGGLVFNTSKNCILGENSAVGTAPGDPNIYGFIFSFRFPEVKSWLDSILAR